MALEGSYVDPTGLVQSYSVWAFVDGTMVDSEGREGTYALEEDPTGGRILTLSVDLGGIIHTLHETSSNCWEEAQPPANPDLVSLAVCIAPGVPTHAIVHYDTMLCDDLDTSPIWHTAAIYPQESGHWMAGRLTADGEFWVHDVSYVLLTSYDVSPYYCSAIDHRARVFMGPSDQPPPVSPNVLFETTVSGASLPDGFTAVTIELPNALYLPEGQSLFVAVEAVDDGLEEVCPAMCGSSTVLPDHTYWSDAANAPYPWYDLSPYTNFHDMMVEAHSIAAG